MSLFPTTGSVHTFVLHEDTGPDIFVDVFAERISIHPGFTLDAAIVGMIASGYTTETEGRHWDLEPLTNWVRFSDRGHAFHHPACTVYPGAFAVLRPIDPTQFPTTGTPVIISRTTGTVAIGARSFPRRVLEHMAYRPKKVSAVHKDLANGMNTLSEHLAVGMGVITAYLAAPGPTDVEQAIGGLVGRYSALAQEGRRKGNGKAALLFGERTGLLLLHYMRALWGVYPDITHPDCPLVNGAAFADFSRQCVSSPGFAAGQAAYAALGNACVSSQDLTEQGDPVQSAHHQIAVRALLPHIDAAIIAALPTTSLRTAAAAQKSP